MKQPKELAVLEAQGNQPICSVTPCPEKGDTVECKAVLTSRSLEELKAIQGTIKQRARATTVDMVVSGKWLTILRIIMPHGMLTGTVEKETGLTARACLDRRHAFGFIHTKVLGRPQTLEAVMRTTVEEIVAALASYSTFRQLLPNKRKERNHVKKSVVTNPNNEVLKKRLEQTLQSAAQLPACEKDDFIKHMEQIVSGCLSPWRMEGPTKVKQQRIEASIDRDLFS